MGATTTVSGRPEGVVWIQGTFSLVPQWTVERDSEAVITAVVALFLLRIPSTDRVHASYFAEGAFNRVYVIRTGEGHDELIMRVPLPVEPTWKTSSEVATMEWVRQNTSLPVPRVFAHDANRDNRLGFEWILMAKVPGNTLEDAWASMDFPAKKRLVQQIANFSSSLFKKQLRGIGNIYPASESNPKCQDGRDSDQPAVQRIVSTEFFVGDRARNSASRGLFGRARISWRRVRQWLSTITTALSADALEKKT